MEFQRNKYVGGLNLAECHRRRRFDYLLLNINVAAFQLEWGSQLVSQLQKVLPWA